MNPSLAGNRMHINEEAAIPRQQDSKKTVQARKDGKKNHDKTCGYKENTRASHFHSTLNKPQKFTGAAMGSHQNDYRLHAMYETYICLIQQIFL